MGVGMQSFEQVVLAAERQLLGAGLSFGHGMLNAYDEAVYAAQFCARLPVYEAPDWDAVYPDDAQNQLQVMIERRCLEKLPLAYLTQEAFLYGYRFYVDERVIVPRSFIAELILEGFSPWVNPASVCDVLELCTGSGCLAIMAADVFEAARVDAVDISPEALAVAHRNVAEYGLEGRVRLVESDLYQALDVGRRYDIVFSNPPYVNSGSMSLLPDEYRAEPEIALAGGEDGMDLVREIVGRAAQFLKPGGILVVEIGNEYEYAVRAFGHLPLTWLDVSGSDDGVFLVTQHDLARYAGSIG